MSIELLMSIVRVGSVPALVRRHTSTVTPESKTTDSNSLLEYNEEHQNLSGGLLHVPLIRLLPVDLHNKLDACKSPGKPTMQLFMCLCTVQRLLLLLLCMTYYLRCSLSIYACTSCQQCIYSSRILTQGTQHQFDAPDCTEFITMDSTCPSPILEALNARGPIVVMHRMRSGDPHNIPAPSTA